MGVPARLASAASSVSAVRASPAGLAEPEGPAVLSTASVVGAGLAGADAVGAEAEGRGDAVAVPSASASVCCRTSARSGASPASVAGWAAATRSYRASSAALVRTAVVRSLCSGLVRAARAAPVRSAAGRSSLSQPASTVPATSAPAAVSAPLRVVPVDRTFLLRA